MLFLSIFGLPNQLKYRRMNPDKAAFYAGLTEEYQTRLNKIQTKIYRIGTLRLLCVILTGVSLYFLYPQGSAILISIGLTGVVLFCILCLFHNKLFHQKSYYQSAIAVCRRELQLLRYDFSGIGTGKSYQNNEHDYSNDLDIFGEKSLFSYLNRSASFIGESRLAEILQNPYTDTDVIKRRQEATAEMADKTELRIRFQALGGIHEEKAADKREILALANIPLSPSPFMRQIIRILPFFWVIAILAAGTGFINGNWLLLPFLACATLAFIRNKSVTQIQTQVSKSLASLRIYSRLFKTIEQETFYSPALSDIASSLSVSGESVSKRIKQLSSILSDLDQRCNAIAFLLLNGLFLWDFRQLGRISDWQKENARQLSSWLDALAEFDVYCTFGTFCYNHPDYVFPVLNDTNTPVLKAEAMGHPLIDPEICVRNPIELPGRPSFIVVTGANMAGKSTYLRTIGCNLLLAMTGAPVCAHKMEFSPCRLYTSLRTTDSLANHESYFFAELKRLQRMVERLQQGEKLFIILDEILKGTNSIDKQRGSLALIEHLIKLNAAGVIATHDLQLGRLADQYPQYVRNFRFEAEIQQDELFFPYRIQPGIAQNMNAYFLMKKMGIIII